MSIKFLSQVPCSSRSVLSSTYFKIVERSERVSGINYSASIQKFKFLYMIRNPTHMSTVGHDNSRPQFQYLEAEAGRSSLRLSWQHSEFQGSPNTEWDCLNASPPLPPKRICIYKTEKVFIFLSAATDLGCEFRHSHHSGVWSSDTHITLGCEFRHTHITLGCKFRHTHTTLGYEIQTHSYHSGV